MVGTRIVNLFAPIGRRRIRPSRALLSSVALAAGVGMSVIGPASAAPGPNQPPMSPPPNSSGGTSPATTNQPGGGTNAGANPTATPRCTRAQLRLKFVDMQAATGHRYVDYSFKNISPLDCSLRGYPGAELLNKNHHFLGGTRDRFRDDPVSPVRTVVIKPGKRAFFTFSWGDGGFCPGNSFTFYGVHLVPPKDRFGFTRRYAPTSACGGSVQVTRVRPKLFRL